MSKKTAVPYIENVFDDRSALWALDGEVPGLISGRTDFGKRIFTDIILQYKSR